MLSSIKNTLFKEKAYSQSAKLELVTLLLKPFSSVKLGNLKELIAKDPLFAAKALIFAKTKYNVRDNSFYGAVLLAKYASGNEWSKLFYDRVVNRVDDMTEILSCYFSHNKERKLPNALKKGFAIAFNRFDNDEIMSCSGAVNGVKLRDVINLVHPLPTFRNSQALEDLVANKLGITIVETPKVIELSIDVEDVMSEIEQIKL